MAEIFNFYVQDNRSIQFPKNNLLEPIMQEDHKVATWRFRIPKTLNGIDMSAWAWWFVYTNAKNEKFSELLTLVDDIDEPDSYCTADYDIDYGISYNPGNFQFSLEAINADSGGEVLNEWHTKTYAHKVDKTLQGNQAQWAETESDIISALIIEVQNKVAQLVGGATPEPVSLIADMTDTSKVYLYVGSETGESTNYWYYYNGSAWVAGGLYASGITVDSTPTQGSSNAVSSGGVYTELTGLKEDLNNAESVLFKSENVISSMWGEGGRAVNTGNRAGATDPLLRINTDKLSVAGNVGVVCNSGYQFVLFAWNSENTYLGWWRNDGGTTGFVKTTLGNADRFYTEMRLADLVTNGAATISIVMQKTGGETAITLGDYSNAYLLTDVVSGLSNDVLELKGESDFLTETKSAFAYFTSNGQPTFTLGDGSITVAKNSGNFRIYTNKGLLKTFTALGTHTITNVQKLVYDLDDDQIKVVVGTQSGNYILLFSFAGNNFNGILYPYYLKQQFEDVNSRIDNATDTAAEDFALSNVADGSDFKAVFFSDIHSASANMTSILAFASSNASKVDAILNGGDTAARWLNDTTYSLTWYTDAITTSSIDILSAIGNHDAWDGAYFTKASAVDIYNAFIAPIVAKYTGIVQPTGAAENGLCYYYKDYASKVRVVVLNAMDESTCDFWDSEQATWFNDVLADAKTKDLAVVCLEHAPYPLPLSIRNTKADNWSTWYPLQTDGVKLETEAMDIVADFIASGGKFVCWLSGHLHEDNLLEATGYTGQIMVNIVTADAGRRNKVGVNTAASSPYFDGFNYIGVDTTNGLLKVYRKGWDMDAGMKKHDYLCYDFVNHQVIAN